MNIKWFRNNVEKELKKPLTFPILAEGVITGAIIYFEDYYSGILLHAGVNKIDTKGKRHSSKVPITDSSVWRILGDDEDIILSNKNPDNN